MSKRKGTSNQGQNYKKGKVESFIAWAINHRALETFLAPHLVDLDFIMLSITCKTMKEHVFAIKRKEDKHILKDFMPVLNAAVQLGYFKLACWLKDKGCEFLLSKKPKYAGIFQPFAKEKAYQKRLLKELVFNNPDCPDNYYCGIAYWGNPELVHKMIRKHKNDADFQNKDAKEAASRGHIFVLEKMQDKHCIVTHGLYSIAIEHGQIGVLDWLVNMWIDMDLLDLDFAVKWLYFPASVKQIIDVQGEKVYMENVGKFRSWLKDHVTIRDAIETQRSLPNYIVIESNSL